jgi:hypothetical protein
MSRHVFRPSLVLAGGAALMGYFSSRVYSSISIPSELAIKSSNKITDSFAQSFAASAVNPDHHITVNDTRFVIVSVSNGFSHEQILAKFLAGFFGGYVFAPERMALRLLRQQLVNFKGERTQQPRGTRSADGVVGLKSLPVSRHIWTAAEINGTQLPPLHSILFGAFRIVDIQQSSLAEEPLGRLPARPSYVDIAFGADDGFIAGVHRFSVSEVEDSAHAEGKRHVTITFDHTSCNPKESRPLGPELLQTLHLWYAMLLFKEGVVNVLR